MELTEKEMREIHADFSHFASDALADIIHRIVKEREEEDDVQHTRTD